MKKKKTGPITGELAIRLIAIKKLCEQNSGGKWKCPVATSSVEWEGRNYWLVQHPELGDGVSELAETKWIGVDRHKSYLFHGDRPYMMIEGNDNYSTTWST